MKKNLFCIFFLVGILSVFAGCSSKKNDNILIEYNNLFSIQDSLPIDVNKIYETLFDPYIIRGGRSCTERFEDLQDKKIFEIVRYSQGKYYTASRLSDGSFLFMLFEEKDTFDETIPLFLVDGFRVKELLRKDEFNFIKVGTPKETVLRIDPYAYDKESYTIHRFSDESVTMIKYQQDSNNNLIVSEIEEMETENSVISYLIPQDLYLISKK